MKLLGSCRNYLLHNSRKSRDVTNHRSPSLLTKLENLFSASEFNDSKFEKVEKISARAMQKQQTGKGMISSFRNFHSLPKIFFRRTYFWVMAKGEKLMNKPEKYFEIVSSSGHFIIVVEGSSLPPSRTNLIISPFSQLLHCGIICIHIPFRRTLLLLRRKSLE